MSNQQVLDIESDIQQYRADIALGESLERLWNNPQFKDVVLKGYLEKEAVSLVQELAKRTNQNPEKQDELAKALNAISGLGNFFDTIRLRADIAKRSLNDAQNTLSEVIRQSD